MSPTRPPIHVPAPFPEASEWLRVAYDSLVVQAAYLGTFSEHKAEDKAFLRQELTFRRHLATYIHRFRQEARKRCDQWERQMKRAERHQGASSAAYAEAADMARLLTDVLTNVDPQPNRDAIKALEAIV